MSLQRYAALLRGINLGSRNKVVMGDLRELVESLGYEDVSTYVQSGNVVFSSSLTSPARIEKSIEDGIRRRLGLEVATLVRSARDLETIVGKNPFIRARGGTRDPATLHVTFLSGAPSLSKAEELRSKHPGPDDLAFSGREVYLCCPNGYGRSKLGNSFFEKELGVDATTRNWRTVTKLLELVRRD